jgi:hypothetical protein
MFERIFVGTRFFLKMTLQEFFEAFVKTIFESGVELAEPTRVFKPNAIRGVEVERPKTSKIKKGIPNFVALLSANPMFFEAFVDTNIEGKVALKRF